MDKGTAIHCAAPILAQYGHTDPAVLRLRLLGAGLSKAQAIAAARFIPLAFGRELLKGMGVTLTDYYVRSGAIDEERKLDAEPIFTAASYLASIIAKESPEIFGAVAIQSSEVQAVNAALNAGSDAKDLIASPPVVVVDKDEPAEEAKPWWKVW